MNRPRRTDPGRRERILDAVLDLIARDGSAGATYRSVAEAADVPMGSMPVNKSWWRTRCST